MKISTILKDIFLALASTLLFGGGIGFLGVWLFDAEISTMLHVSVYIFLLMFAIWLLIDYQDMKNEQAYQQAVREEEEKQYTVIISTTRSPHPISIFMNEDYNRALRLMKQINMARLVY